MPSHKQKIWLGAILLLGLILRIIALKASALTDDAYITFRYARNLASGHGFVYNIGERVLGTTTPLFTILLTPFAGAGLPLDTTAIALAIALDLLICVLLYRLFRESLGGSVALLTALFYALSYVNIAACSYGMETQVFMLLVIASILLLSSKRYCTMAVTAGLALLTRPEGVLLAVILCIATFARLSRDDPALAWKSVLTFVVVTAPWFVLAAVYFGSPFPNSLLAKIFQRGITAREWLDFFVLRNPVSILLWLGAAVGFFIGVKNRCQAIMVLAAWAVAYTLFFLAGRPPFLGGWYFPPAVLPITVLSAVGASWVLGRILRGKGRGVAAAAILMIVLIVVIIPRSLQTARWHRRVVENVYRPIGEWIKSETRPEDIIHACDIGYLGYISGRRILDASALVTPDIRKHYERHKERPDWDISFVLEKMPDYVVLPIGGNVYKRFWNSDFARHYEPVRRFQVEGLTELYLSGDASLMYEGDRRFMADFIIYRRNPARQSSPDDSPGSWTPEGNSQEIRHTGVQ